MTAKALSTAILSITLVALAPDIAVGQMMEKKGTTPYVTHFIFRPLMSIDIPGLGTATPLEAVGTTQNMNGEKMLDKMSARCVALNVASGEKNTSMAPACWLMAMGTTFSRPLTLVTSTAPNLAWAVERT